MYGAKQFNPYIEQEETTAMTIPRIDTSPVDDRSESNIKTLLPEVQVLARSLVHAAQKIGITIKVISGSRTYEEQHAIYLQGRESLDVVNAARQKAGMEPIEQNENKNVSNVDAGHSNHNFQIAFDIGVFEGKKYLAESPLYKEVAALGKQLGLSWGGDWKHLRDEPHYELRPQWAADLSEKDMLVELGIRKESGKPIYT
jgi:peptidoglycan L-alanyl-D-glutamate endopeptidase CwlK